MKSLSSGCAVAALVVLYCFAAVSGCGGRGVEQVAVTGAITLGGGPMPAPGTIYFTPVAAAGGPLRPSSAGFGTDGRYAAGAFDEGRGLIPGTYKVAIECWKVSPATEDAVPESYIPRHYHDPATSGLELTVEPGARSMRQDFDLRTALP